MKLSLLNSEGACVFSKLNSYQFFQKVLLEDVVITDLPDLLGHQKLPVTFLPEDLLSAKT